MYIGVILALVSCLQFAASEKQPGKFGFFASFQVNVVTLYELNGK